MTTDDAPTLELLLRHQSLVRSIARDLLVDPDAADDVVQQTWLAALRHAASGAAVGRSLLARIAINLAFNRRRDARRRAAHEQRAAVAESLPSVAESVELEEQRRRVVDAVFALHEPLRTTVLRRYIDDRSENEVAAALGVPVATVHTRLNRARAILRERLGNSGDAPRSARALVALAGWSSEEAATAIGGGKGVLLMGAKAWVGVAAGVAVLAVVGWWSTSRFFDSSSSASEHELAVADATQDAGADESALVETRTPTDAVRSEQAATATAPAEAARVRGRCIRSSDSAPLEGIHVSIVKNGTSESLGAATSAADGWFDATIPSPALDERRVLSIHAAADGWWSADRRAQDARGPVLIVGDLYMSPTVRITGRVVDESGQPVVGANVGLISNGHPNTGWTLMENVPAEIWRTASDADGSFGIDALFDATHQFIARADGMLTGISSRIEFRENETPAEVVIRLERVRPADRLSVIVLKANGAPLPDVEVDHQVHDGDLDWGGTMQTDAQGRLALASPSTATHEFSIWAADGRRASIEGVSPGQSDVVLQLPDAALVAVVVRDGATGLAVRPNRILARGSKTFGNVRLRPTDREPWVVAAPDEVWSLTVNADGYEPKTLDGLPAAGPREALVVDLTASARATPSAGRIGVVLADGKPVADAVVELLIHGQPMEGNMFAHTRQRVGASVKTARDGTFRIPLPNDVGQGYRPDSRYSVRAEVEGFAATESDPFTPKDVERLAPLELRMTRGGALRGTFIPRAGRTAAGSVIAATRGDGHVVMTRVEEDGTYAFEHLAAGGWRVEMRWTDVADDRFFQSDRVPPAPNVQIADGQTTVFDVNAVAPTGFTLTGTFHLDASALPMKGAALLIDPRGDPIDAEAIARGAETTFLCLRMGIKPSGVYTVFADRQTRCVLELSVQDAVDELRLLRDLESPAPSSPIDLDVVTGVVEGRTAPSKEPYAKIALTMALDGGWHARATTRVREDGSFTFAHVPIGIGTLWFADGSQRQLTVTAGQTTRVE